MGLKKGEKIKRFHRIKIISVTRERLWDICGHVDDVEAEGFPDWTVFQFIEFFCQTHGCTWGKWITRIEFRHL